MSLALGAVLISGGLYALIKYGFSCGNKNLSFPITKKPGQRLLPAAQLTGTYVACLDCGREMPYDWNKMKVLTNREVKKHARNSAVVTSS